MSNFSKYFKADYQYALKNITYNMIENDLDDEIQLNCIDSLSTSVMGKTLKVNVCRKVFFSPETIFDLSVTSSIILEFKDDLDVEIINNLDWQKELSESSNSFLSNILCRTSGVISSITAAYGHHPVITPPDFIAE